MAEPITEKTERTLLDYWQQNPHGPQWPAVHPGWRKAQHPAGITYYGPWEDVWAGFPEHCRRVARALSASGPVHLRSSVGGQQFQTHLDYEQHEAFEQMRAAFKPLLEASIGAIHAEVRQVIGDDTIYHKICGPTHHWMDAEQWAYVQSRTVIYTVFERDRVSPSAIECMKRAGQVWVANRADAAMLKRLGMPEERVKVVPVPFYKDDPHLALRDRPRIPGPARFYHIGKWEPRKAGAEMLLAFLLAFGPGEAQFYLKTSERGPKLKSGYPESPGEALKRALAHPDVAKRWTLELANAHVRIIAKRLSQEDLWKLHRTGDVYLSIARGEGFDMPAFDARLAGKVLCYTPSGGPQDFALAGQGVRDPDIEVPTSGTVPCDPFYGWGEARYLDFELADVVGGLRAAAKLAVDAERMAARKAWEVIDFEEHLYPTFGLEPVGARAREYIEEITGPGCRWPEDPAAP